MTTFAAFSDLLPDPVNKITDAGDISTNGNAGPGFASATVRSTKDTQVSRTISGRGISRESGAHTWEVDITYNPMLRAQFEPVNAFLLARNARMNPFFVILPQYSKPRDPTFATFAASHVFSTPALNAGANNMMMSTTAAISGSLKPGDVFTITDVNDVNHMKAYMVTFVETNSYFQASTTQPTTAQNRVHFNPPLVRDVAANSVINFINPKFRVITKTDVQEYSLNTDNLYSFSLSLEEIQP